MRGERVLVRAFGNQPVVARVWDVGEKVIYICGEEQYQRMLSGSETLVPIGFPREDVFEYSEAAASLIRDYNDGKPLDWNKLTPWRGNSKAG